MNEIEASSPPAIDLLALVASAPRSRIGPRDYILALVDSFPCLRGKWDGPWDIDRFVKRSGPWSSGEKYAARFIACVWNPQYAEQKRWRFNVVEAMGCWDRANRAAFLNWAANPYWP